MANVGLSSGLAGLLAKLGLMSPKGEGKVDVKGLEAKGQGEKPGLEKGALLGEDGALLAGLGYAGEDKQTLLKNLSEKGNVARFLQEMKGPKEKGGLEKGKEEGEGGKAEAQEAPKEAKEKREVVEREVRREEAKDEARLQGQKETQEQKEAHEGRELKAERERDQERDEEEKPGAGWVQEELEQEEKERKRGLRDRDALGETFRCRGEIEDGTRCLRKPVTGTPYCREHAVIAFVPPIHKA